MRESLDTAWRAPFATHHGALFLHRLLPIELGTSLARFEAHVVRASGCLGHAVYPTPNIFFHRSPRERERPLGDEREESVNQCANPSNKTQRDA